MLLENVICAAAALLSVWGAVSLVYTLLICFVRPKKSVRTVITVFADGSAQDAVQHVSCLLARLSVTGAPEKTRIAAVCGDNGEVRAALLSAFCAERRVTVCGKEEYIALFLE